MKNKLTAYIKARRPIIWIDSADYKEVDNMIKEAVDEYENKAIYEFRAFGLINFKNKSIENTNTSLYNLLDTIFNEGYEKNIFLIIKNCEEINNSKVIAYMKKIAEKVYTEKKYNFNIIIVDEEVKVRKELEKFTSIVEISNMKKEEIEKYIENFSKNNGVKISRQDLGDLAISLKGLSKLELDHILNVISEENNNMISKAASHIIIKEKGQIIKKSSILEIIDFKENIEDIGGLGALKEWLQNKSKILRNLDEAKKFGVDTPKGVLLVGMPGCGKSLSAKASARLFNIPLLRLDIGRILGKYVGESENNMRKALKTAESISPCILWVDEIEKAFSGAGNDQSGGASDITKRLFGYFLTWLQEKENTVFVVATANDISIFPPEFLRKGRFDEIFFIDFPNEEERKKIFEIHLEKRIQDRSGIDIEKLVQKTKEYCGSDIEEVVKTAVEKMFLKSNEEKMKTEDLLKAIKSVDPLSKILSEKIENLKEMYKKFNLKSAASVEKEKKSKNEDMVIVSGGKFKSEFSDEEITVGDMEVGKYPVTQDLYEKIMEENPSFFKGERLPVEQVSWWEALDFCNKLSQFEGLKPVYVFEDEKLRIQEADGKIVHPSKAKFENTEGYRLPTLIEWEWFASGGQTAVQNGTFGFRTDNEDEVAWYFGNSNGKTHSVGTKKKNELGIYDCLGNVWEWIFDSAGDIKRYNDMLFIYDEAVEKKRLVGGGFDTKEYKIDEAVKFIPSFFNIKEYEIMRNGDYFASRNISKKIIRDCSSSSDNFFGFRIVRSI